VQKIETGQIDEKIMSIYGQLQNEPKVKWKESFKEIVGLPLSDQIGSDQ
jgi:hypothetical protein